MGRFIQQHLYTLLILPAAIALLLIIAFPLVYSLWMAVHEYSMGATTPPLFVGAANYLNLLRNQRFQETVCERFFSSAEVTGLLQRSGLIGLESSDFNFADDPTVGNLKTWWVARKG